MGSIQSTTSVIKPKAPVQAAQPKQPVKQEEGMKTKDVLKLTGKAAGGAVAGASAVWVQDLFFHFGNNGGEAYKGGVYAAGAAAGAAIGAGLGLRKYHKQQEAKKAQQQ